MSNSTIHVPVSAVTPPPIQPAPVQPPAVPVAIVDSTKNGINAVLAGTTLTITDSGVVPPPVYKFPVGSSAVTIAAATVRGAPGPGGSAGPAIGQVAANTTGVVKTTPIPASSGFNWLQLQFPAILGYVGDDNLNPLEPQS
jgi:hypothetical protein